MALGEWQHAAVTYDGTVLRLYLNGAEVGNTLLSGAVAVDASAATAVGAQPSGAGSKYFDGIIDDVRIMSRALSAAEINEIASGGN